MINIKPLKAYTDNYIWLLETNEDVSVVDPGDASPVLEYLEKYNKGSDEFYFKEIEYETYGKVCPSIKDYLYEKPDYSIVTLGQMHHLMEEGWSGWYSKYFI